MTEESYQQGRKIMQRANYLRGRITDAKGKVGKWTKIQMSFDENKQTAKAEGARKMLDFALIELDKRRKVFDDLEFPDSNIANLKKETAQCEICGTQIDKGLEYCERCIS